MYKEFQNSKGKRFNRHRYDLEDATNPKSLSLMVIEIQLAT